MLATLFKVSILTVILRLGSTNILRDARELHQPQLSSKTDFQYLASLSNPDYINKVLDNILIPRVVGTENHEKVFKYIKQQLKLLNWHVQVDEFTDRAPIFGNLKFKNIVATPNPQAERFLVLACHYDSKYFKDEVFVGAIDSAVPCAMMLEIAKSLAKELEDNKDSPVALKLVFFDGEEAFEHWGPKDSIYGAKHLAKELYNNRSVINGQTINELDRIDVLVLLDLIGAKNPVFMNYFENTQHWFTRLAQLEYELHQMNLLKDHRYRYFHTQKSYGQVEDDHIPFLKKDVPILHLIVTPFPREWHTPKDNRDIVDMDTVLNINLILKIFITEYLHLSRIEADVSSENPTPLIIVFFCVLTFFIYKNFVQ